MALDAKGLKIDNYILDRKFRLQGCLLWRFSFTGFSKQTSEEIPFFIEFYLLNPGVSPKEVLVAQKSRPKLSENDLQYALAGTSSASIASTENSIVPSYVLVKCGRYGKNPKQYNAFFPAEDFSWNKKEKYIKIGTCYLTPEAMSGKVSVSDGALIERPELLCNTGTMEWRLRFEKQITSSEGENEKNNCWYPIGLKTVFAGTVFFDGEEFSILPKNSFGYIDKAWGRDFCSPYFHLSSCNVSSMISGSTFLKTAFSIQGEFSERLRLVLNLEGKKIEMLESSPFSRITEIHDFIEMPNDDDGQKVHWVSSFHKGKLIIDTDVFCPADEMLVKDFEMPKGGKALLKVLSGGTGTGEMRIYKKAGKNIELIEHLKIEGCLCDFGTIDE